MDRANAILTGQEQATADDFIEWIEEEAFRIGSLGYGDGHANFEEVFAYLQPMKSRSEEDNEGTDLPECLAKKAMEDTHAAIVMMERKRQFMKANRPLQAMTEVRIDRELLAAGKSREDIKRYPKTEGRLRQKILDLHSLKHPLPDPPKGVDTLVVLGPKLDRRYPVSLQMDADLAEVLSFLEYICAVDDYRSQGWHKPAQHTWKYQLVTKDKKMKNAPPSTPLVSDADYQHLITQFKGMETSRAIVTLVSAGFECAESQLNQSSRLSPQRCSLTILSSASPIMVTISGILSTRTEFLISIHASISTKSR